MPKHVRPVLVTGSNRSGTTWIGRMLCQSRQLFYLHEPFNPSTWPRYFSEPVPFRNLYVSAENESDFVDSARSILDGALPITSNMRGIRSARRAAKFVREVGRHAVMRRLTSAVLIKDPIAIFSTEWLARRLGLQVVVAIRNPVAYAGSLKRLGWRFDFHNWLDQPLLIRDLLSSFEDDIRAFVAREHDIIDEAILQWNCHYHVVQEFRTRHPEWYFLDHDVVAEDPVGEFAKLYSALGLRFDSKTRTAIERNNAPGNIADAPPGKPGPVRRDSRAARHTWRHRLTQDEVARVHAGDGPGRGQLLRQLTTLVAAIHCEQRGASDTARVGAIHRSE